MKKITVFTPTYNRAHTLPRLYESLNDQTSNNFEWLVVDDGSSDNTEELVNHFIEEANFPIQYLKQKNQGKHIAINRGMNNANGDYFMVVDSDDYLLPKAIEVFDKLILKIVDKSDFAAITAIHFVDTICYNPENYGKKEWLLEEGYHWEHQGEMVYCFKTAVLRKFPFPQFEGEKFCPESLVFNRIKQKYKILATDHVIARGDYLAGGLSDNFGKLILKNPRAFMLSYAEKLGNVETRAGKKYYAKFYWNIALKAKNVSWLEKFRGIPLRHSIGFWTARLLKRG